jgi:oligoribonuclease NrnB/cAMP/cGMP phosphodiesterase (DHH superfamily)
MTAAWIAKQFWPDAELFGAKYGQDPPHVHDRRVMVVDFAYPRDVLLDMDEVSELLIVLDHHASHRDACVGLDFCCFDMTKSGAGLTWDHFYLDAKPRPDWINAVEDRDLWQFKLEGTREFHAYMSSFPISIESCDRFHEGEFPKMIAGGVSILRYVHNTISKIVDERRMVNIDGRHVAVANAPYQYASQAAGEMLEIETSADYAMCWFARRDGRVQFSLRSRDGETDVADIAKRYGGGGHVTAAGYSQRWLPIGITG